MAEQRIVVIGAGIIGSSIAYHLAKAGAPPLIIDAGEGGGVTTPTSWAWLNASWGNPEPYYRLRMRSIAEWHRLARELPDLPIHFRGSLTWDVPPGELERYVAQHAAWGYRIRLVGRLEMREREPRLSTPPEIAALCEDEGVAEPKASAIMLREAALKLGARQMLRTKVERLLLEGGRAIGIRANGEALHADTIVIAAGNGSLALAAHAGFTLPFSTPPGLLVNTQIYPRLLQGLLIAPGLELRQTAEGRLLGGIDFTGELIGDEANSARVVLERIAGMLDLPEPPALDHTTIGERPLPGDGFPAIGRVPGVEGLYLTVMHSGMTLAAGVGALAAEELLEGRRDSLLGPYGPERFAWHR
jgi:glycine/D-amino acid oxidase-like deaminating enzyme